MKPDVLTITAIVFVVGVLLSTSGITGGSDKKNQVAPPALQQGVSLN